MAYLLPWLVRRLEEALDLLLPPRCAGCGRPGAWWCAACAQAVAPIQPPICSACGAPWDGEGHCPGCQEDPLALDGIRSCCLYAGPVRRALHQIKFHGRFAVAQALAPLMAEGWSRFSLEADLVLPVPAAPARQRERGYNQAALLARAMAAQLSLPLEETALRRIRGAPSQVGRSRTARRENVREAFQADPQRVDGRRVVVVDDVCTTGATLEACAAALYRAGARSVWGFTLARTPRRV